MADSIFNTPIVIPTQEECDAFAISEQGNNLSAAFTTQCFSARDEIAKKQELLDVVPAQLTIMTDKSVCACLRSKPVIAALLESAPPVPATVGSSNPQNAAQWDANKTVNVINNELMNELNGMIFQASLLNNTVSAETLLNKLNMSSVQSDLEAKILETNGNLQSRVGTLDPGLNVGVMPGLLSGEGDEGKCITRREFQTYRMIPKGPDFYQFMNETALVFKEDDWNYEKIQSELRAVKIRLLNPQRSPITTVQDQKKSAELSSRLLFLNNNALYKNLFASKSNSSNVREAKQKLFNNIKTAFSLRVCTSSVTATDKSDYANCPGEFAASDKLEQLNRSNRDVFSDQKVRDEVAKAGIDRLKDILDSTPERVSKMVAKPDYFMKGSPSQLAKCRSRIADSQTLGMCLSRFGDYCRELDQHLNEYSDGLDIQIRDESYDQMTSGQDNQMSEFEDFYQFACVRPRFKFQFNPFSKSAMTFEQYKTEVCGARNVPAECKAPVARKALLGRFIKEFPVTDDVTSMTEQAFYDKELEMEVVTGFLKCQDSECPRESHVEDNNDIIVVGSFKRRSSSMSDPLPSSVVASATSGSPRIRGRSEMRDLSSALARGATPPPRAQAPAAARAETTTAAATIASVRGEGVATTPLEIAPTTIAALRSSAAVTNLNLDQVRSIRDEVVRGADIATPQASSSSNLDPLRTQLSAEISRLGNREQQISALNQRVEELQRSRATAATDEESEEENSTASRSPASTRSSGGFSGGASQVQSAQAASLPSFGSGQQVFSVGSASSSSSGAASPSMNVKYDKVSEAKTENGALIMAAPVTTEGEGPRVIDPQILRQASDAGAFSVSPETWDGIVSGSNPNAGKDLVARAQSFPGDIVKFTVSSPKGQMRVVVYKGTGQFLIQPVRSRLAELNTVIDTVAPSRN